MISDERPSLYAVNLKESVRSALQLVRMSCPDKQVTVREDFLQILPVDVLADDLLNEVFANIFSNSVRYTEGIEVEIEIEIKEDKKGMWAISISDKGRGVVEEMKTRLFSRYLESAKGSGLGMSIVHALVVERYKGKIEVKSRVAIDYTKGTTVEITLPKA